MRKAQFACFGDQPRSEWSAVSFLFSLIIGFLGGVVSDLWWFSYHSALGELKARQFITYMTHPWIAAMITLIFYGMHHGGIISGPGSGEEINSYGIAGVSCSNEMLGKLGGLFFKP